VVREGVGAGGEMTQALYAHMNNKTIKREKERAVTTRLRYRNGRGH
jgi:NaMN:DMB phosphoribosyltransferase